MAILFTTVHRRRLLIYVGSLENAGSAISLLGGTTALLLLAVFTVVNICCLVLRRDPAQHEHFRAPTVLPIIGAICCAYLVTPLTGRNPQQYVIAGLLLAVGVVLWLVTFLINRAMWAGRPT